MSVPDPATTDWVPLWSLGAAPLPADTVVAAAIRIIANKLLAGDTQPAWRVMGDGKLEWGAGGATAPDTSLYRAAADIVATDDLFQSIRASAAAPALGARIAGEANLRAYFQADGKLLWTDGASGADTNLHRAAAGVVKTDGAFASAAYGTTLPASPVDGQEYVLVDSTTNPTYQWRFRYNAGSSSAYKWEFVGGSALKNIVEALEQTASLTAVDLTTPGPTLTVPRTGDYEVSVEVVRVVASGATSWVNGGAEVAKNGTLVADPIPAAYGSTFGGAVTFVSAASVGYVNANASDILKIMYRVVDCAVAGEAAAFWRRRLRLIPVRVA